MQIYKRLFWLCGIIALFTGLLLQTAYATKFGLPSANETLLGNVSYVTAKAGDTLVSIGQRQNVGVNAMLSANPGLIENQPLEAGASIKIPAVFLLPSLSRQGIIINLPEMRMYYYPANSNEILTYPIGIGKIGKTIPLAYTSVTKKIVNPTWTPPKDIREFNKEKGIELPYSMPPGPDNPLGPYAIYMRIPTYLIHSTIFPESIGRRASFGCIRMHENDIKQFFPLVQPKTPIVIVDMPNKVGWSNDILYLESHSPLEERSNEPQAGISRIVHDIQRSLPKNGVTLINWQVVSYLSEQHDGMPHEIGFKAS